jgi:hypothetical protein
VQRFLRERHGWGGSSQRHNERHSREYNSCGRGAAKLVDLSIPNSQEHDMGFWAIWQYDEYVGKHTSPGEKMKLFRDSQELWDDSYPNIYMAFEALPKWLSVENIISLNDKDINFHALLDSID